MKILITGAGSGIGFDTAINLINRGHFVYITVHRKKQIKTVIDKLKELELFHNVSVFKLDIKNKKDRNLINNLDIDCLITNAAIGYSGSILDISIDKIKDNFEVNVFSNLELIQTYCKKIINHNLKGKVIVMSSLAGRVPIPFLGSYSASKSSLISLITCLKKELEYEYDNIKIKLIEPGIYNTGFNEVMIENKEKSIYFNNKNINKVSKKLFNSIGKNNNNSIVSKIITAVETENNKLVYSAPLLQKMTVKIYNLFM